MQRFGLFFTQSWYINLPVRQRELVQTSFELYAREERTSSHFSDYSFIVFPMAKAYEGFLKKYFYDLQLIDQEMYVDKHFRIGRALNPDVYPDRRDKQWIYGNLRELCGEETSRGLWNTWLTCRNQLFHYFPDNQKKLSFEEAGEYIEMLAQAMNNAIECRIQKLGSHP